MKLREIRQQRGLSQYRAARLIGVPETQMSQWELGKTTPSLESLVKLADFYGVTLDELVGRQVQAS